MRMLSFLIVLTSLTGCASAISDATTGYASAPTTPAVATDSSSSSRSRIASADGARARDLDLVGASPAPFEPKFVPRELAAPTLREPSPHRDFVECWQCRR